MRALDLSLTSDNWIESVDLGVLFFRLTLDSATEFLFGTSVDSQLDVFQSYGMLHSEAGAPNSSEFATAFDESQNTLAARARLDRLYWLFSPNKFRKNCKIWSAELPFELFCILILISTSPSSPSHEVTFTTCRHPFNNQDRLSRTCEALYLKLRTLASIFRVVRSPKTGNLM